MIQALTVDEIVHHPNYVMCDVYLFTYDSTYVTAISVHSVAAQIFILRKTRGNILDFLLPHTQIHYHILV